ncbi:MAG: glycosyltransferase, partial [Clostridia bacterium]|nr:glycosyltransferase [Clostridia bacterium]
MKVLQVNCVYKKGSTGKIVHDIHTELEKRGIESVVCYGRGARIREPHVYKTCPEWYSKLQNLLSRFTGLMYGGCLFSTAKLIRTIKKEKPDIVHLHCINGYFVNIYRLVTWLKRSGIKTVLTLHAEFMHTANCGYALDCEKWKSGCGKCPRLRRETKSFLFDRTHASWRKMKKAFEGFGEDLIITSVSPWLMERAQDSPILVDRRHVTVLNGLDPAVFCYREATDLRAEFGLENAK